MRLSYAPLSMYKDASGVSNTTRDAYLSLVLQNVSAAIERYTRRQFARQYKTLLYTLLPVDRGDLIDPYTLLLRDDLDTFKTFTNGDSTTIPESAFVFMPRNAAQSRMLYLPPESNYQYATDSSGSVVQAVSLYGIFGYGGEWNTASTLSLALDASATSFTVVDATGYEAMQLIRIDDEYLLVTAVTGTTLSVDRGVHGSTAASHLSGAAVDLFVPDPVVVSATLRYAAWRVQNDLSPQFGSYGVGDGSGQTTATSMLPEGVRSELSAARLIAPARIIAL